MTGDILYDLFALFAFAIGSVGSVFHWEKIKIAAIKWKFGILVFASVLSIMLAWYLWAIFGVGALVKNFNKEETVNASAQVAEPPVRGASEPQDSRLSQAGQAGDMFGGFTALVTALTFGGAIGALIFQAKAMRAAREQLTLQQFEPMFLFLLDQYKRLDLELKFKRSRHSVSLVPLSDAISDWSSSFNRFFEEHSASPDAELEKSILRRKVALFYTTRIYSINSQQLGTLFRSLYHVFKAIKVSNLSLEQKTRYANIARLGLDDDHLFLLALNGVASAGRGFRPLIEEYGLLKHLFREPVIGAPVPRTPIQIVARSFYGHTAALTAARRERYWKRNPHKRPGPLIET